MLIIIILASILLVAFIVVVLYQQRLIHEVRLLARETEEQQRQIIAEQERNQQLKQEMTSNIAHELKTPVASIRGYLEILLGDKPLAEEKQRHFLERSYQQTLRLTDLIRDVSLINKLEEADDLFPRAPINLHIIAQEALQELGDKAASHGDTLSNLLPEELTVEGNHDLAYSIFRNLVENAIEHAGEGVSIVVERYKEDAESHYLHFYDTGCGVDNQYLDRLFDRFLRIEEGRSRKSGGTGLGLSIVKHAVRFHGGTIYAKNRDQGGLEFFFSIKKIDHAYTPYPNQIQRH